MVLELEPGALAGCTGVARYTKEFMSPVTPIADSSVFLYESVEWLRKRSSLRVRVAGSDEVLHGGLRRTVREWS